MRTRLGLALAVLLVMPACTIYFGDDDDDDDCFYDVDDTIASTGLRNPETGDCQFFGGGGGCGDDTPVPGEGAPQPDLDWGTCPSACESLSESDCWAAERCHAAYIVTECPNCDAIPSPTFLGCWEIAPSGPANDRVACESLDAQECSRHNDCVANYTQAFARDRAAEAPQNRFSSCGPEPFLGCWDASECPAGWTCSAETDCWPAPGCDPSTGEACPPVCYGRCEPPDACDAIFCGPGTHCEESCPPCDPFEADTICPACDVVCVPDNNQCPIECPVGSECVEICADCDPNDSDCSGVCTYDCVPTGGTCADVTCGPGEECQLECSTTEPPVPGGGGGGGGMDECWPVCVPVGGGSCAAVDCGPGYHCEELCVDPPVCPPGQMCPGGSCGPVCVPDSQPGQCESITDEMVCLAAAPECRPLYTGTCWIDPNGQWQCTDTSFVRCETTGPAVPPQP
jgi:hypothetical protein